MLAAVLLVAGCSREDSATSTAATPDPAERQPALATSEPSCAQEVGAEASAELVRRCMAVSPATRPPCNAQNACSLIEAEIARGCGMLGLDAPAECAPPR
jgi:hypothetical protein